MSRYTRKSRQAGGWRSGGAYFDAGKVSHIEPTGSGKSPAFTKRLLTPIELEVHHFSFGEYRGSTREIVNL
jgi:hypothetical protein